MVNVGKHLLAMETIVILMPSGSLRTVQELIFIGTFQAVLLLLISPITRRTQVTLSVAIPTTVALLNIQDLNMADSNWYGIYRTSPVAKTTTFATSRSTTTTFNTSIAINTTFATTRATTTTFTTAFNTTRATLRSTSFYQ